LISRIECQFERSKRFTTQVCRMKFWGFELFENFGSNGWTKTIPTKWKEIDCFNQLECERIWPSDSLPPLATPILNMPRCEPESKDKNSIWKRFHCKERN
jgi:hypothetical protein